VSARRLRLDLGYDGTDFRGWAAQPGLRTVQGEIEAALAMAAREEATTTVAGRTDAGVHARHQVCHVDVSDEAWARLTPRGCEGDEAATASSIVRRLNKILAGRYGERTRGRGLPAARGTCDVRIYAAALVDASFDARFSALGRRYAYRVSDRPEPLGRWDRLWVEEPLDEESMNEAGARLLGEHDFLGFCRPREGATTIRTLRSLTVWRDAQGTLTFEVEADAFCHSMVRSLVGALLLVGQGSRGIDYPASILRARSRSKAAPIAPAHGLTLEGVDYPDPSRWAERAKQARARREACCGGDG